ncbi:superinfection immunity protein [Bradyrhizobium sp. SZCCHNR3118]|uniref:superinfection immunity protein n=1 Tax=Bradyrhizobium sp. SZCCHNR3118 TaxID=3057468 RepID=UPI002916F9B2|nr:superinfection immunity protein [Bradyrhizobium sp. SZCCHNR3118]
MSIWHWIVTLFLIGMYFLPALIAFSRTHHQRVAILLLNLFLGWTGLGWIGALVWSATASAPAQQVVIVDRRST